MIGKMRESPGRGEAVETIRVPPHLSVPFFLGLAPEQPFMRPLQTSLLRKQAMTDSWS